MTFNDFVTFYWGKTRRNGKSWDPATIADDSGLPIGQVEAWWGWLLSHSGTDAELIALWENAGLVPVNTPGFGTLYVPKASGDPNKLASQLTVGELEAMFVRHCGK